MTGAVLVTGATGFIGREVTRRLIAGGRHVIALARARGGAPARERVAEALAAGGGQVEVIEGDLARPGCALGADTVRRLRERVETAVHCAGDTSFFPDTPEAFRAGHVDGPCELLERLHGGRLRRWGHLSTAYVCGRRTGTILESEGHVGQTFRNLYERVKLESETVIRAAGSRLSVDVRIFRPSVVVGDAPQTTGGDPSLLFFGLIRMAAALAQQASGSDLPVRVPLEPDARVNLVPLAYAAEAIVSLAEHPDAAGQTFHLVVRDAPSHREILRHISGRFGLGGIVLTDPRSDPLDAPIPLERKIGRLLAAYREYLEEDLCFDDRNARRVLDRTGLRRPILSAEALDRLIDQALGRGRAAGPGRDRSNRADSGVSPAPDRRRCVA